MVSETETEIGFAVRNENGSYNVNPYWIPSPSRTVHRFFRQLEMSNHLREMSRLIGNARDGQGGTRALYFFISGSPRDEKRNLLEDCLYEFRKVCIKDRIDEGAVRSAGTMEEKVSLIQEHPVVVHTMYLQFFCILQRNNVCYDFSDFGIGTNADFRFDVFYREDHEELLGEGVEN